MKKYSLHLLTVIFLITGIASCKKETDPKFKEIEGFADNNMVMYWNDKVATVLGAGMPQPYRTRYFAIIQIAVHDALNNIKPKYESYSLDERTKHADPNAAVASAAYWAIKGLDQQGSFPVDEWYTESLATCS